MHKHGDERIRNLIKVKLLEVLTRESHNPAFNTLSITRLWLDRSHVLAKVYFTCYGFDPAQTEKHLNDNATHLKNRLFRILKIKNVPRLEFYYDKGINHSERIDEILHHIELKNKPPRVQEIKSPNPAPSNKFDTDENI